MSADGFDWLTGDGMSIVSRFSASNEDNIALAGIGVFIVQIEYLVDSVVT